MIILLGTRMDDTGTCWLLFREPAKFAVFDAKMKQPTWFVGKVFI